MKKSANLIYSIRRNLQTRCPMTSPFLSLCAAREGLMTEGIDVRAKVEGVACTGL